MSKICGIYMIQSKIKPERVYIGSSRNITNRISLHKSKLKKNFHHTPKLQNHANKYGTDDLVFSIIELCAPESLIIREQFYMDAIKPWFNSRLIAESNAGFKLSEKTKKWLSEFKKGKPLSQEHKDSLCKAWDKRRLIPESEETKYKKHIAALGRKPWSTGLTKETDERLRLRAEKQKGTKFSKEAADKISKKLKGIPHSKEHNKKVGDALRGKKQSDEVVEAKRKRVLEWWAKKKAGDKKKS